jgi:hypothetical protein
MRICASVPSVAVRQGRSAAGRRDIRPGRASVVSPGCQRVVTLIKMCRLGGAFRPHLPPF